MNEPADSDVTRSTTAGTAPASDRGRDRRIPPSGWTLLVMGLLGGSVAALLVGAFDGFLHVSPEIGQLYLKRLGGLTEEEDARLKAAEASLHRQTTALAIGLAGLAVGGFLGLGAGLLRRSTAASFGGLGIGAVMGAGFGAGGGLAGAASSMWLQDHSKLPLSQMALIVQAGEWLAVGIGITVAVSFISRHWRAVARILAAAAIATVIAVCLYHLVAAVLFPMEQSDQPVPSGAWNRLVWIELVAGLMSLAIGAAMHPSERGVAHTTDAA